MHTSGANTRLKAIHADHLRVWKCQMSMCHMDALLTNMDILIPGCKNHVMNEVGGLEEIPG